MADDGTLPAMERTGVILAGDLYSAPEANKRGATGDITPVWNAFATIAKWVTGVLGNHDLLPASSLRRLQRFADVTVLDGDTIERDNLRIGGVSLITGNAAKPGRRDTSDQTALIAAVIREAPDILVLHEGPPGTERVQRGNPNINTAIGGRFKGLTVCGHCHWPTPTSTADQQQTVNVDQRVIIITNPS